MHVFFILLILILTNFKRLFPEVLLDKFLNSLSHYLMRHKAKRTKAEKIFLNSLVCKDLSVVTIDLVTTFTGLG